MNREFNADAPVDRLGRRFADLRVINHRSLQLPLPLLHAEGDLRSRLRVRLAGIFGRMGLRKLRLTGGEPTVRAELPTLVRMLREALPDVDLALTTNGSRLASLAPELRAAGLDRVTVSLDSVDPEICREMNGVDFPHERVLEGIDAAAAAGLGPVKINAVVKRGVNDEGLVDMARHFRGTGSHRALHRVHGCRRDQRLETG